MEALLNTIMPTSKYIKEVKTKNLRWIHIGNNGTSEINYLKNNYPWNKVY